MEMFQLNFEGDDWLKVICNECSVMGSPGCFIYYFVTTEEGDERGGERIQTIHWIEMASTTKIDLSPSS